MCRVQGSAVQWSWQRWRAPILKNLREGTDDTSDL
jgi:hypothetical protein